MAYTITWKSGNSLVGTCATRDGENPDVNWLKESSSSGTLQGLLGENIAASQIASDHWVGSMLEWRPTMGFWISATAAGTATFSAAQPISNPLYDIQVGNKLIAIPGDSTNTYVLSSAFTSAVDGVSITSVIGSLEAATYDTGTSSWVGSLTTLSAGSSYWIKSSSGLGKTKIFKDSIIEGSTTAVTCNITGDPEVIFRQNRSQNQAFYIFQTCLDLEGNILPSDSYVTSYNSLCAEYCGFAEWSLAENLTVPVLGNDGTNPTSGYFNASDTISFRIYDSGRQQYYGGIVMDSNGDPISLSGFTNLDINRYYSISATDCS